MKYLKLMALTELLAICVSFLGAVLVIFDPAIDTPLLNMVILLHAGVWTIASLFLITGAMVEVVTRG